VDQLEEQIAGTGADAQVTDLIRRAADGCGKWGGDFPPRSRRVIARR